MRWSRSGIRQAARPRREQGLLGAEQLEPRTLLSAVPAPAADDPLFASQWNLRNVGQYSGAAGTDIRATTAWSVTTGSRSVVVGVVDSGIDITHPDLAANIWTNPGEIPGNGIDDDRNGYVDDIHGWNFVDNNNDVSDAYGHGTHVAGIIGATGNNGAGVAGVAWQVSLMALKFEDGRGVGSTSAMLAALNYATMMRRDHGINIVATNNSWQTPTGPSVVVANAIRAEGDAGITFVAAAGNNASDNDATARYPGGYRLPNVITVAALDTTNSLASMSNYGATTVDLAAPGSLIESTFPGGTYGILSGTSMAAPEVTGVVALLASARPGITVAEVRTAILGSTTPVAGLAGKTVTGGRLDAAAALGLPPVASVAWAHPVGRIAISANTAISLTAGNSVAVIEDASAANVHVQAKVSVGPVTGMAAGLVARYGGPGDNGMYLGRLVKRPLGYVAQILVNSHGSWVLLGMRAAPRGGGLLRFDVVDNRLTLQFNGRILVDLHNNAITRAGTVGLRTTGSGIRCDDFVATQP